MSGQVLRRVVFRRRPEGAPVAEDFAIREEPLPEPGSGEVLVAARVISIDPYVRTMIDAANPYGVPMPLEQTVVGDIAGEVITSNNPTWAVGDWVAGRLGWASHGLDDGGKLRRIDPALGALPMHLALFGPSTGYTAYFGMMDVGRPHPTQQVLVSGAAGAVGQIASQLAKDAGARVVGIAGGREKCDHLTDRLGLDEAIDHHADDLATQLDTLFPDGIDIYFDNVGGPITEEVMKRLARHARVVVCGESSQYNAIGHEFNPRILGPLMDSRASMAGFLVSDFAHRFDEARVALANLHRDGRLKVEIHIVDGLDKAPAAFIAMLKGGNIGKCLVSVA